MSPTLPTWIHIWHEWTPTPELIRYLQMLTISQAPQESKKCLIRFQSIRGVKSCLQISTNLPPLGFYFYFYNIPFKAMCTLSNWLLFNFSSRGSNNEKVKLSLLAMMSCNYVGLPERGKLQRADPVEVYQRYQHIYVFKMLRSQEYKNGMKRAVFKKTLTFFLRLSWPQKPSLIWNKRRIGSPEWKRCLNPLGFV